MIKCVSLFIFQLFDHIIRRPAERPCKAVVSLHGDINGGKAGSKIVKLLKSLHSATPVGAMQSNVHHSALLAISIQAFLLIGEGPSFSYAQKPWHGYHPGPNAPQVGASEPSAAASYYGSIRPARQNWFIKPAFYACKKEAFQFCSAQFSAAPVSGESYLQCLGTAVSSSNGPSTISTVCTEALANVTSNVAAIRASCDSDFISVCPDMDTSSLLGMQGCLIPNLHRLSSSCLASVSAALSSTLSAASERQNWNGPWGYGAQGMSASGPWGSAGGPGGSGYSLVAAAAVGAASAGMVGLVLAAIAAARRRRSISSSAAVDGATFVAFPAASLATGRRAESGGVIASEPPLLQADSLA